MSKLVSRPAKGAKDPVCLPTEAQAAWLADVRLLREVLMLAADVGRAARRIRHGRYEAPEAVALDHLVTVLTRALDFVDRARAEGRPLEEVVPPWELAGEQLPALRLGRRRAQVVSLAPYLVARKERARG